jgi:hypothetical protein
VWVLYFFLGVLAGWVTMPFFVYWLVLKTEGEDRARELM